MISEDVQTQKAARGAQQPLPLMLHHLPELADLCRKPQRIANVLGGAEGTNSHTLQKEDPSLSDLDGGSCTRISWGKTPLVEATIDRRAECIPIPHDGDILGGFLWEGV